MDKKTIKTVVGIAGGCIVLYWLLQNIQLVFHLFNKAVSLLYPFIIGGIIAFIFNVPMRAIEKKLPKKLKKFRRVAAILLTLVLFIAIFALVLQLLLPQLHATGRLIAQKLPAFWNDTQKLLKDTLVQYPALGEWLNDAAELDWSSFLKTALEWAKRGGLALVASASTAATGLLSGFLNFFISFVFAIYILAQKETLARQFKMLLFAYLPQHRASRIVEILQLSNRTFSKFLSGQCVEACILGGMFAVGMLLCRMPFIPVISVVIAVTALVPIFGAFLGCFIGAFLILVQNPMQAVWFVVLFLVIQQLEGNLVYPRVVGTSVGLPSIWVLLAVTIGGSTLGIFGMLIMIPLFSVIYSLLRSSTRSRLRSRAIPVSSYSEEKTPPAKS